MHVPFVDLKRPGRELRGEFDAAFESVIERAAYTMGPELTQFEEAFAAFCGCDHAVGVSSGTDAVKLALHGRRRAARRRGHRPGQHLHRHRRGREPHRRDAGVRRLPREHGLMDTAADRARGHAAHHGGRARAPVRAARGHGRARRGRRRHGLAVVEDACQAHGATYKGRPSGSFGVTAAFSFYPGKNLGALGDGGAVTTNDAAAADTVRLYRNHGQADKYTHQVVGYCDRLHNLQAALLLVKLPHLAAWNEARRAAARDYDSALAGRRGDGHGARANVEAVYHLYVVRWTTGTGCASDWESRASSPGSTTRCRCTCSRPTPSWATAPGDFPVAERGRSASSRCRCSREIDQRQRAYVVAALEQALA